MQRTVVGVLAGVALLTASEAATAQVGDAARGQRLFGERGCAACHGEGGGGGSAPALSGRPGFTPSAMAGAMWTHAAEMWEAIERAEMARPRLSPQEAADIHVFLSGAVQDEAPGDPVRGHEVFEAKLCVACHEPGGYGMVTLTRPAGGFSAYTLIASLWEHGNGMLARMAATGRKWQTLSPEETASLLAYLNTSE
jgi:mono/diheme cytochrome c family protein